MTLSDLRKQSDLEIENIQKNYIDKVLETLLSQKHLYREYIVKAFFEYRVFRINSYHYLNIIDSRGEFNTDHKVNHGLIPLSKQTLCFDLNTNKLVFRIYSKDVDLYTEKNFVYKELQSIEDIDLFNFICRESNRIKFHYNKKFLHYIVMMSFVDEVNISYSELMKYIPELNIEEKKFLEDRNFILNAFFSKKCNKYLSEKRKNYTFRGFCKTVNRKLDFVRVSFSNKDFDDMHNSFRVNRAIKALEGR